MNKYSCNIWDKISKIIGKVNLTNFGTNVIFPGAENAYANKILYNTKGYVNDYDPNVNPNVLNEHSSAAFRYFHTLIAGYLK